jgi:hypothetical protein
MQQSPEYVDVVAEVHAFLLCRVQACLQAGIPREHMVLDPGFGFGKTLSHNLDLLANLDHIAEMGLPVMAGLSATAWATWTEISQRMSSAGELGLQPVVELTDVVFARHQHAAVAVHA